MTKELKRNEELARWQQRYLCRNREGRSRMLAETDLSVKEIAMQTGFGDEFYFSRLFRQKLNLTPSQWRNRSRHYK